MSFSAFGLLAIALGGLSLLAPVGLAICAMIWLTLFRTAAAFNLPSLGGLSIISANVFLVFYVVRALRRSGIGPFVRAITPPSAGIWLALLACYAVISAVFLPRLLSGITETIAIVRTPEGTTSLELRPLANNMMYVTQLVYFLGGVAAFMTTFALMQLRDGFRYLRIAIYTLLGVHIAVALLDLATYLTGTAFLMDFIRTANYAMLTDVEKAGLKRLTGSFSEASSFACFTLVMFATSLSLWLDGDRPRLTAAFSATMLVLLLMSTSGTAYVGLACFLVLVLLYEACGPFVGRAIRRPIALIALAGAGLCGLLLVCVLAPSVADGVTEFFGETLFGKLTDASGRERMMWNEVAFQNFLDTGGFGVGIGGARASSYLLVLLSNVGWPGLSLFALFVASVLWRPVHPSLSKRDSVLITALRCGIVGTVVAEGIVGAVFDIGLLFYIMTGAVAAASFPVRNSLPAQFPVDVRGACPALVASGPLTRGTA